MVIKASLILQYGNELTKLCVAYMLYTDISYHKQDCCRVKIIVIFSSTNYDCIFDLYSKHRVT